MAELDPQPVEPIETVEAVEPGVYSAPRRPRTVSSGMWGLPEIAVVAAGAISLMAMIIFYVLGVIPSNRELARNKSEADRLDAEVLSAKSKYGDITSTSTQVAKIVGSVDEFETRLAARSNGQAALYQRLNGLFGAYGLINSTGPDYQPLDGIDAAKPGQVQADDEKGRAKFRSLYPGVYISTTVEGSYQNLRRFIREIETGREFIIISAIELAPSDTESQRTTESGPTQASDTQPVQKGFNRPVGVGMDSQPAGGKGLNQPLGIGGIASQSQRLVPKGKMHGETVALHIEMAAYFRRPNFSLVVPAEQ